MKRVPTKKSHSWWWDSHISPKNSRWLSENLEQMDRLVKEMLKLIEEDGDSFAKKAEMYYKHRPELVQHVEEFYRMYRALAERYDIVTGELRNNIQLQTHGSGSGSDFGIEPPSPDQTPKDSGSDSDNGKVEDDINESSSEPNPNAHVIELENELREARERIQEYEKRLNDLENTTTSASIDQPHFSNGPVASEAEPSDINGEMRHLKEAMEAAAKQYESEISSKDQRIDECKTQLDAAQEKFMQDKFSIETELKSCISELQITIKHLLEGKSLLETRVSESEQTIKEMKTMADQAFANLEQETILKFDNFETAKLRELEERVEELQAEKMKACNESSKQISELNRSLDGFKLKVDMLTSEKDELRAQASNTEEHMHQLHLEHMKLIGEVEDARKASVELRSRVRELEEV